jgi:hypothetical protein
MSSGSNMSDSSGSDGMRGIKSLSNHATYIHTVHTIVNHAVSTINSVPPIHGAILLLGETSKVHRVALKSMTVRAMPAPMKLASTTKSLIRLSMPYVEMGLATSANPPHNGNVAIASVHEPLGLVPFSIASKHLVQRSALPSICT